MILTLTMNPAVDRTVRIDDFGVDKVNRILETRLDAAGKGINVSRVVKALGGRTRTFAFLGGPNGQFIEDCLNKEKIGLTKIKIDSNVRENLKVVDRLKGTFTDINASGPIIQEASVQQLKERLIHSATHQSVVVLTGSIPPGIDKRIYAELITELKSFGAKTVLDADGDLFAYGIESVPTIIKPNIHELESYVGKTLSEEEVIQTAQKFVEKGVEIVAISLGEKGALFVTKKDVFRAYGLNVDVKSTVGAGDALVAGLCYGLHKGIPLEETIALAIAASAAQVTVVGTKPPTFDKVYELVKFVNIEKVGDE